MKMDWVVWLVVQLGGGQSRGAWRLILVLSFSSGGFSSSKHMSIGFQVKRALDYGAGKKIIQLEMSLPWGSDNCPIEDEP